MVLIRLKDYVQGYDDMDYIRIDSDMNHIYYYSSYGDCDLRLMDEQDINRMSIYTYNKMCDDIRELYPDFKIKKFKFVKQDTEKDNEKNKGDNDGRRFQKKLGKIQNEVLSKKQDSLESEKRWNRSYAQRYANVRNGKRKYSYWNTKQWADK